MHSIKWMVQKLVLYWFEYFLFRIKTRFRLLFWRLCKLSSCINPVLDPYFCIKGIKKTQSLRFFHQINCDKIWNNSNIFIFGVQTVLFDRYINFAYSLSYLCTTTPFKSRKMLIWTAYLTSLLNKFHFLNKNSKRMFAKMF